MNVEEKYLTEKRIAHPYNKELGAKLKFQLSNDTRRIIAQLQAAIDKGVKAEPIIQQLASSAYNDGFIQGKELK